jgi:hypothetical protein
MFFLNSSFKIHHFHLGVVTNYLLSSSSAKILTRWANACRAGWSAIASASVEVLAEVYHVPRDGLHTLALAKVGSLTFCFVGDEARHVSRGDESLTLFGARVVPTRSSLVCLGWYSVRTASTYFNLLKIPPPPVKK